MGMKTEIPKEDGWYWMASPHWAVQQMSRAFTDWGGARSLMVMNPINPPGFKVYPDSSIDHKDLEGAIFTKIEVPQ